MNQIKVVVDKDYKVSEIDPRIYGSFIEHIGRAVYGGIYEPDHPKADKEGFRTDVLEKVRNLRVPVVRYPGGNFVSGFRWEDSVGPRHMRKSRLDLAWASSEPNTIGLHEFKSWCDKANSDMMYAINLGSRGVEAAQAVVEYCNHKRGSYWSDQRIVNGAKDPFDIKLWCLGNEMDGPWQIGHKSALEYGRIANEAGKVMKWVDPSIELVACGSSYQSMPSFARWELEVLDQCYDTVDYISLHQYFDDTACDTPEYLAKTVDLDAYIKTVASICDAVKGKKRNKKTVHLSFDEWNVWHRAQNDYRVILKDKRWSEAPPILENSYTLIDALLVGSILITLLRNADRVKIACLAQLVNVIAPIMAYPQEDCWVQSVYWPFYHTSVFGRGTALNTIVQSPKYDSSHHEAVPTADSVATMDDAGNIVIFVVNRNTLESDRLVVDLKGFESLAFVEHLVLEHEDSIAVNTSKQPCNLMPKPLKGATLRDNRLEALLPKLSWNVIRIKTKCQ